jgi:hypothetical protein
MAVYGGASLGGHVTIKVTVTPHTRRTELLCVLLRPHLLQGRAHITWMTLWRSTLLEVYTHPLLTSSINRTTHPSVASDTYLLLTFIAMFYCRAYHLSVYISYPFGVVAHLALPSFLTTHHYQTSPPPLPTILPAPCRPRCK